MDVSRHPLTAVAAAAGLTVPWDSLWAGGAVDGLPTGVTVAVSGVAILGEPPRPVDVE